MTAILKPPADALDRLTEAVRNARCARHHLECQCGLYRSTSAEDRGAPYCTTEERFWSKTVDRLLHAVVQEF